MTSKFGILLRSNRIYQPLEIGIMLNNALSGEKPIRYGKILYYNVPCSFDIETSSFYSDSGEKRCCMYVWALGINGLTMIGRTWEDFQNVLTYIQMYLNTWEKTRLLIYVHNLSYDFQFFRKWLHFEKVFSIDSRKPAYAITDTGLEFRCSYILTGKSLEKIGNELKSYPVKKMVGDLDYSQIRHSGTNLTDQELHYVVNDVKVVMSYIQECIDSEGNIGKIPLTKTGYVRRYCRDCCFYEKDKDKKKSFKRVNYRDLVGNLKLTTEQYKELKRCFQGGFTHANPFCVNKTIRNVSSDDFTSSYPAVMVAEKFPMGNAEYVKLESAEDFYKNLKLYCCMFDMVIDGLEPKIWYENYISLYRCRHTKNVVCANGRVVSADHIETTVTEQDFYVIRKFYKWKSLKVGNFYRFKKSYLPKDFILSILNLYKDKTELKGVSGREVDYMLSKELLNSCYGMTVTDIVKIITEYENDDWVTPFNDLDPVDRIRAIDDKTHDEIIKYNENRGRFLYYPWGVWVTAYARKNLFTAILEFGNDYVYSDTDSIKSVNRETHLEYFEKYNAAILEKLKHAMDFHNLPYDLIMPKTINGETKVLGVWDYEGCYEKFKTLGAKRYIYQDTGELHATIAGVSKKESARYLRDKYKNHAFFAFNNGLHIPKDKTGKLTHTYIDHEMTGQITDLYGIQGDYYEKSGVHLEPADFSISISKEYADYLAGLEDIEI